MNISITRIMRIIFSIIPVIISAMGGALMVFASYDDSPGGTLLGFVLIIIALYLVIKKKKATHNV